MHVVGLSEIDAGMIGLVGGKAAGLGEMIAAGERVPPGFCLTTEAHRAGAIPEDALARAYERLGGGPVAVRSSATAEDLPDASFAGQQDTILNVEGVEELVDAVRRCWESLDSERAVAYRRDNEIDGDDVHMAVVVQRMVDADTAGVLFTADPLSGSRSVMVADAVRGLGTAVVDGSTDPDHYEMGPDGIHGPEDGCLTRDQVEELRAAGDRLQRHFGSPQDAEWAYDSDGVLWLLQSRAITTLFPLPDDAHLPRPRAYMEVGNIQGLLRPVTPMGMSMMDVLVEEWMGSYLKDRRTGEAVPLMTGVGSRLYLDMTEFLRSRRLRSRLPSMADVYGPRAKAAIRHLLDDPRFAPAKGAAISLGPTVRLALRYALPGAAGVIGSVARPEQARARVDRAIRFLREQSADPLPAGASAAERLKFVQENGGGGVMFRGLMQLMWPLFAGIVLTTAPGAVLKGIITEEEADTALGGMPHNVTTQMDMALWGMAVRAREHRDLFLHTPPEELAEKYRAGTLPDIGMEEFLRLYGHRAAAEVDIGMPRWGDDPAPLFGTIANYLRVDDPEQAPDRRFARAAERAEAVIAEVERRVRRRHRIRGRLGLFLMRRSRELTGLREVAKFAWLIPYWETRRQLVLIGEELAARGLLEHSGDIMFLKLPEVRTAIEQGADHRETVTERRAFYRRELRRPEVPALLLSDGTDVEALLPAPPPAEGAMVGKPAAAGQATGRARVVRDPVGAHLEPGEILVAPTTDPGWTPLFMTAAGLVTETGSPIAHGPTVAREYGIPAVICLQNATRRIKDGDLITIDGTAGTVMPVDEDGSGENGSGESGESGGNASEKTAGREPEHADRN
ncbi:PEP/pyruvate-binding domain-containing protein [Nocardiopsis potens]|uniref:PEP/pyruvate-binding domain-containing protein n=1 Tax=Nocardiopsis potens TaxID=1246458 RepID=UPI00035FD272|nr:PEP/pyruvate-binding domain-containing protein [Nocardiopsis potens]